MARNNATANRALHLARKILSRSVEQGYRLDNPAASVRPLKESPPEPRALTDVELRQLKKELVQAPIHIQTIVELALETAMRIGEIVNLKVDDIDPTAGIIHIRMPKSGEPERVQITPAVNRTLDAAKVFRIEGNPHLFPSRQGPGHIAPPYKALRKLFADAGIAHAGFHIFRKTAATTLANLTQGDVLLTSKFLRHRSTRTTERYYLATDQQRLRQVAAELGDVIERRLKGGDE